MLIEVIMETLLPYLMASLVDNGINGIGSDGTQGDMRHILLIGGCMIGIAGVSLFSGIMGGKFSAKASAGLAKNLRQGMFRNIQTFSFSNIDKFSTAGLVTRLTTDVNNIQNAYQMILRMCMRAPASLICAMAVSFSINARIACIYLIAAAVLGCILAIIIKKATKYFTQAFPKYDDLNASVQENVSAIRVVKAYVREDHETKRFKTASNNLYKLFLKAENIIIFNGPVMSLTVYTCILLISYLGAKTIVECGNGTNIEAAGGVLTTGMLMTLLSYCMNILMNLMMLSIIFVMLSMSTASAKRIAEVLDEKADLTNPEKPVHEVKDGGIRFENVCFKYNKEANENVLSNIELDIKPGETIGIIGGTGSAKTTLVNLIGRLYDVTGGSVKVGGIDVREYDIETLRDEVSVVLQKNVLFSGTILDNLRWGDENATEEECRHACKLACVDDFVESLPDKYETRVEQGGTNFSGGQKQRLCIARALIKKPKILILDDSTSAVDTATDKRIRNAFATEIPNTTKLIIAQRIASVMNSDRIIVMDNGRVSAFGTHDELMEKSHIYRDVYESQTGGAGDFDENGGEL